MNKNIIVGSLLLGAIAAHAAVFEDRFDRTDTTFNADGVSIGANWKNAGDSNPWKISDGTVAVDVREMPAILYSTVQETTSGHGSNFTVSAEVAILAPNCWAGLVFNFQDADNFYCLRFKAGTRTYQLLAKIDGEWSILASHSDAAEPFAPGTSYSLKVFSEDAHEFYFTLRKPGSDAVLNPVANATDSYSHFKNGYAGLYSPSAGAGEVDAVFDNFRVEISANPPRKHLQFTEAEPVRTCRIVERLPVQTVWAATPVGFALETAGNRQFVAFYDANRQMTVGQRTLDSKDWKFKKLPSFLKWDSHNYIEMTIDSDGYIHISGNMHVVPLVYFRSEKPYDVSSLKEIGRMVGEREQHCTYPKFLKGPNGELIFNYRDGSSGKGDQLYNVYNLKTRTWRRLIDQPLADGQGERNAYFVDPLLGSDGWFHITWVWRDTPDCSSNHDLSYARSKDLVRWETAKGIPITLPIRLDTPGVIVDPVPVRGGMLNGNGKIGFDSQNRVVLAYHKFDENGKTQLYNARLENGTWKIYQTSDWNYRWYFSGGGCIINKVHISPVEVSSRGLLQSFSHAREGSGLFVLDEATLKPTGFLRSMPWPKEIGAVRSDFPEMQTKTRMDRNPDSGYLLRWETLPSHRDVARPKPWPKPVMLEVYKVETETQ